MSETVSRRAFGGLAIGGVAGLAGCSAQDPLTDGSLPEMGNFKLALAITVSENAKKIPPTRNASLDDWKRVMNAEIERRFGGYTGDKEFIIAVNIDGYSLAPPGIPIVLTPKSILVVSANLWTANPQEKVEGPHQLTTFEGADTLFVGSGLIKDADEQMLTLARNMARAIQSWMLRTPERFGLPA